MRSVRQRVRVLPAPEPDPSQPPLHEPTPGYEPTPRPWQDIHVLADGQTLEISSVHGSGDRLHSLEADESDADVVVVTMRLAFAEPPQPYGFRTAIGYPFRARVRLARPLAGRAAVDGALGTQEQVREQELETAVRWRAELGLPTDRRLVAGLVDQSRMPDGRLYGQEVMSDDEQVWYRQALDDKEAAANFAKGWLAAQTEDLDGHAEITWNDGGDFVQYVTRGAEELRAAAAAAGIRRLRVEPVAYAYRQLDRVHTAYANGWPARASRSGEAAPTYAPTWSRSSSTAMPAQPSKHADWRPGSQLRTRSASLRQADVRGGRSGSSRAIRA